MPAPQHAHELVHVVIIGGKYWRASQARGDLPARSCVQPLHGHQDHKHTVFFPEAVHRVAHRGEVAVVGRIHAWPGGVEVNRAVMALLVGASQRARGVLCQRRLHRPPERVDRADDQHGSPFIPASRAQRLATVFGAVRLKGPGGVCPQFGGHAQFAEQPLGLFIARDHQRLAAVAPHHLGEQRIHLTGLSTVADGKFVLGRRDAQRSDHHRRQGVGELAFEHRAFARHHAVVLAHFAIEERRKNVGQMNLCGIAEIAAGEREVLRHHTQGEVCGAENAPDLPQHLLDAHV